MEAKWQWVILTAIAPVAWGANYFVTKQFLPQADPLWGALFRALPAGIILLLLSRTLPHGSWWWKSLVLGALNVGAFFVLVYVASQLLPSSIASTIMATSAAVLMVLAWPLVGERPSRLSLLGVVLGFVGVCVLVFPGGTQIKVLGVLASLAAMLLSSFGFLLTKRWAPTESTIAMTSWQLVGGGLLVLPFAVALEGSPPALSTRTSVGFLYVILVATALAFVVWFTGLRHLPAGTVGLIGLLNPVTGVALGTIFAGEVFGWRQFIGTVLILLGVLIGQQKRKEARAPLKDVRKGEQHNPSIPPPVGLCTKE